MTSEKQPIPVHKQCDLCRQKMNPTAHTYHQDHHLCSSCLQHMKALPDAVAKSVERFLSGNVV